MKDKPIKFLYNENLKEDVKKLFNNYYKLYSKIESDNTLINTYNNGDNVLEYLKK